MKCDHVNCKIKLLSLNVPFETSLADTETLEEVLVVKWVELGAAGASDFAPQRWSPTQRDCTQTRTHPYRTARSVEL